MGNDWNADDADWIDLHGYQNEILHGLVQLLFVFGRNEIAIYPGSNNFPLLIIKIKINQNVYLFWLTIFHSL